MSSQSLLSILQVGRDASIRGSGISLRDAIAQSCFKELRPTFSATDLVPLIQANPQLINDWLYYSQDKRTSGGWYILESGEVGELATGAKLHFPSMPSAVADYVVRELDFWSGVVG